MSRYSLNLSDRKILLLSFDLILILASTLFGLWIHARGLAHLTFNLPYLGDQIGYLLFLPTMWLFSIYLSGLYDPVKSSDIAGTILLLVQSGLIVLFAYLLVFFYTAPTNLLPRGIVVYQIVSGTALLAAWRAAYVGILGRPMFSRRVLIIGAGWAGKTMAQAILLHAPNHYQILGFIDDNPALQGRKIPIGSEEAQERSGSPSSQTLNKAQGLPGIPVLAGSEALPDLVKEYQIPEVILAITHSIDSSLFRRIMDCKELGVDISLMTERYEELTGRIPIEHIGDNWFVSLPMDAAETSLFYAFGSRVFDIIGALFGLSILLPFFPLLAALIYLDSPGPIFYRQERIGKGGVPFDLFKLRTMIPDAEGQGEAQRAQEDDPRITRVGRWLRKFRLDEMPQLFNILKGEMSAVGPRPERPEHLAELDERVPFHHLRNAVKPGMAGWAVVNFGYIDDLETAKIRLQYDLYYVKHQSLWLDLVILLRTMGQLLLLRGR